MYLVNKSSKLEPVNRVYKIREKSQSLLDHPRINTKYLNLHIVSPSRYITLHPVYLYFVLHIISKLTYIVKISPF